VGTTRRPGPSYPVATAGVARFEHHLPVLRSDPGTVVGEENPHWRTAPVLETPDGHRHRRGVLRGGVLDAVAKRILQQSPQPVSVGIDRRVRLDGQRTAPGAGRLCQASAATLAATGIAPTMSACSTVPIVIRANVSSGVV